MSTFEFHSFFTFLAFAIPSMFMARTQTLWALLLILLISFPAAFAWDKEDYAIFDLTDALKAVNGQDTDFYSVLNVSRDATTSEIQKSYRKASISLHPDKNPDPSAQELFTLLTSVVAILKDTESRERYDGHLRNGIPRWRGTGYFYNHYQPSLLMVVTLLLVAISFVQYVSAWLIYWRRQSDVAAAEATINNLTPTQLRKQLKKRGADSPNISRRALKNVSPVQLLQESGELPLDMINPRPSLKNVLAAQIPRWIIWKILKAPLEGHKENVSRRNSEEDSDSDRARKNQRRKLVVGKDTDMVENYLSSDS